MCRCGVGFTIGAHHCTSGVCTPQRISDHASAIPSALAGIINDTLLPCESGIG